MIELVLVGGYDRLHWRFDGFWSWDIMRHFSELVIAWISRMVYGVWDVSIN